jgi:hypothetical protein
MKNVRFITFLQNMKILVLFIQVKFENFNLKNQLFLHLIFFNKLKNLNRTKTFKNLAQMSNPSFHS